MQVVLLIDFGSTYTKITAVDVEKEVIIGTESSFTTIRTDINEGLNKAIESLEKRTGKLEYSQYLACSSAAGGLKMIASGLVPGVTVTAAKEACLGAGAKVIKVYSFEMNEEDMAEIEKNKPEIFLLAGGTNGGDKRCILHNAKMLSKCNIDFPIIIAGNKEVSHKCKSILNNKETYIVENVMPVFGELNIIPAQNKIREIFLQKIINAKGITKVSELISEIIMPTPSAVMSGIELLSIGYEDEKGIGELIAIDLGGATTDVYSASDGSPKESNVIYKGMEEPFIKRTVEGDIGMRYSVGGIIDEVGVEEIAQISNLSEERVREIIEYIKLNPQTLPIEKSVEDLDFALAAKAVEIAITRHCGKREKIYTSNGIAYLQKGKDLTHVEKVILTGGALINLPCLESISEYVCFNEKSQESMKPKKAEILVDKKYILQAMGLLSKSYPKIAIRIMKKELKYGGN
ncbi:methylaspartate mutase accessory protein GlmL [Terrisporobacter glycolicus]|uniref:methylaspartate mutase accessory protein GlmL n=1 Tax=Terrisporobacter glycolicus TaxID=36841 RepID=UPI003463ED70